VTRSPLIIACLVAPLSLCGPAQAQQAQSISFCDLSKNPSSYSGKQVAFDAEFVTDHIERSLLVSKDCPGQGMLLYTHDGAPGSAAFDDAVRLRPPSHLRESITARFTGTFHFVRKPEMCMLAKEEICRRYIEVSKIENLKLTMTPTDEKR
jgi:hypothetical protein